MAAPLAIFAAIALATGQGDVELDANLAWDGHVATASLTELTVDAASDSDAIVTVRFAQTSPVTSSRVDVRQGKTATVSMPVAFEPDRDAVASYRVAGGDWRPLEAGRVERRPAVAVAAGESTAAWLGDMDRLQTVNGGDLPRTASTYSHITAIGIDRNALARLDEAQLRALLEYAGICGRILLVDPSDQVAALMQQRAGCGGRNFITARSRPEARIAMAELIGRPIDSLPGEQLLGSLLPERGADTRLIAFYLAGFLLIFLLLARIRRPRGTHLAFSVAAALAAGLLWHGGSRQSFVAWAEAATTDRVARYASLERATAKGRGKQVLQMQSLERSPMRISGAGLAVLWSAAAAERRLEWTPSLLQEAGIYASGSFPVESNLRAVEEEDAVTVCNISGRPSQPAFLRWNGANYPIPALAPEARWRLDETTVAAAMAPQLGVLARRAPGDGLTLLQPLSVPANGGTRKAWLMRPETGTTGASPCRM